MVFQESVIRRGPIICTSEFIRCKGKGLVCQNESFWYKFRVLGLRTIMSGFTLVVTSLKLLGKKMKEYICIVFHKDLPQSSHSNFQDPRDSVRQWNRQPIAQFEENRMNVCAISNPKPTSAQSTREKAIEKLTNSLQNISVNLIEASQKVNNNFQR